jgi:HJR/Mrr/RecB family endonuclease
VTDYDPVRLYIEQEEWEKLSESERNQRALDRYVESRKKSKWQIGRDYELYCGYCYEKKGFMVDYFGSYNGLEDLGRDLIISKDNDVRIVQCKYWSKLKQIHENHIMQLYGSVIEYNLENNRHATGILITNTVLSYKAKEFAQVLAIA